MKTEWICTDPDNEQYGKQLDILKFQFKEWDKYNEEWVELLIDLEKYTLSDIIDSINPYYKDLGQVFETYPDSHYWIIAECVFEQESQLY